MTYTIQNPITITDKNDKTFKALAKAFYEAETAVNKDERENRDLYHPAYAYKWNVINRRGCELENKRREACEAIRDWFSREHGYGSYYATDWAHYHIDEYKTFNKFYNEFYLRVVEAEIYRISSVDEKGNITPAYIR